jgi:Ran-binding protein 3
MEEKQGDSAARPFQLRPSILSGSGFGSSFGSFGSAGDKSAKEFSLRPSALTSAAESTIKSEARKRLHEDAESAATVDSEEEVAKKPKTCEEDTPTSPIKLTDDLEKPAGIGTFGFGDEKKKKESNGKDGETNKDCSKNFFSIDSEKNISVFGNNSNNCTVGFNTIKCNEGDDTYESGSNGMNEKDKTSDTVDKDKEKLLENADKYEKSLGSKTHLKEVEKITGEEDERNVLQIFCKLYLFDKTKQCWAEKGRGTLKLNDKCHSEGIFQSRLLFRTQGTNLVLLNMMLWPDMCCERVKEKSVRITEIVPDTKEVKVYLISTTIKDSLQTYIAIDRRIEALKRNMETNEEQKNDTCEKNSNKSLPTDDDDSSTESERISSRENSMYGPTDDSSGQTSPSAAT